MQNLGTKYRNIFIQWSEIKKIQGHKEKKLLRHYLNTIEHITRDGFFKKTGQRVSPDNYERINKNAFAALHQAYNELGSISLEKGPHNQTLYKFPERYPMTMEAWLTTPGGYLKIDREELCKLLEMLNDNELRVYFVLKRIFMAQGSPELGVETWFKVLRDSHLNISQNTLKKCLNSLVEKNLLSIAEPISKSAKFQNRFIIVIKKISLESESTILIDRIQENDSENDQIPENCVHLNKNLNLKRNNLNQSADAKNEKSEEKEVSDFNFYNLDKVNRPLTKATIRRIEERTDLSKYEIQESVKRFSEYYFSHESISNEIDNPVGFLVAHMYQYNSMFIQPEWWIIQRSRIHQGKERFNTAKRDEPLRSGELSSSIQISNVLNELIENFG